jgi:hypothetical protein
MLKKRNWLMVLIALLSLAAITIGEQKMVGVYGWALAVNANGDVTSMSYANPKTELNIEASIEITLDTYGMPTHGKVVFRDGVSRALNFPEEVTVYWDELKGAHSLWSYFATMGKLNTINPYQTSIPQEMFGRFSRVVTMSGAELFGTLAPRYIMNPATGEIFSDWFTLDVKGNPLMMNRHGIDLIQQMK